MSNEEIEIQLWDYIDGLSTPKEQAQIKHLIATDIAWKNKYQELVTFNKDLQLNLEPDELSTDFAKNVMAQIHEPQAAKTKSTVFATWAIRAIAAFFIISIGLLIASYISTADFSSSTTSTLPKFKFTIPSYATKSLHTIIGGAALLFLLMMADSFFRNKLVDKQL